MTMTAQRPPRRYPLAALEAALGITPNPPGRQPTHLDDQLTGDQLLAHRTGFTERTIRTWRTHGLSPKAADTAAIKAGLHPDLIWNYDTEDEHDTQP